MISPASLRTSNSTKFYVPLSRIREQVSAPVADALERLKQEKRIFWAKRHWRKETYFDVNDVVDVFLATQHLSTEGDVLTLQLLVGMGEEYSLHDQIGWVTHPVKETHSAPPNGRLSLEVLLRPESPLFALASYAQRRWEDHGYVNEEKQVRVGREEEHRYVSPLEKVPIREVAAIIGMDERYASKLIWDAQKREDAVLEALIHRTPSHQGLGAPHLVNAVTGLFLHLSHFPNKASIFSPQTIAEYTFHCPTDLVRGACEELELPLRGSAYSTAHYKKLFGRVFVVGVQTYL